MAGEDDLTYDDAGTTADETTTAADDRFDRVGRHARGITSKLFASCDSDPRGSVHRAWGISLLFIAIFFVMAFIEVATLEHDGSKALVIAAVWTALIQFTMAILGTFILKRFPTSFSVGFFLGLVVIVAQQNLILFATFHTYAHGTLHSNHIFANLALTLFCIYMFFALILAHFREHVLINPADAKGAATRRTETEASMEDGASYEGFGEGR